MYAVRKITIIVALMFVAFAAFNTAQATDELDLSVGLKTLPLLANKLSGDVVMAILYDPKIPDSVSEARLINKIIAGGFEAPGGIKLSSIMVSVDDLTKLSSAKVAVFTSGSCTKAVADAAANAGVLTMSSDLGCVESHRCILGIVSRPSVEIYLSMTAADAAKVGFSKAFIMLAKQM